MAICKEDQGVILFCSQFVSGSIDILSTTHNILNIPQAHADSCFHILMMVNEATDLSLGLFEQFFVEIVSYTMLKMTSNSIICTISHIQHVPA